MLQNLMDNFEMYLEGSKVLACLASYLAGVLISFTPCVYPVAPVIVAYTGAHGGGSRLKGLILSLSYVLGMALTYAALGVFAALSGKLFGQIQTNPWTHFFIANLFMLMGLSMLDVFTLNVPQPQFISGIGHGSSSRKGALGSFMIGIASGLIIGPCTTPVLAVLLGFVATTQKVLFGMILLFLFALGMGSLLVLLGTFTGLLASLPKGGFWMVKIKKFFGWVFLGIGEYYLIQAGILWF
jgi:cytochrome c-type biogenesis protein